MNRKAAYAIKLAQRNPREKWLPAKAIRRLTSKAACTWEKIEMIERNTRTIKARDMDKTIQISGLRVPWTGRQGRRATPGALIVYA